jgi:uncharacterized protein (DUF1684 family)
MVEKTTIAFKTEEVTQALQDYYNKINKTNFTFYKNEFVFYEKGRYIEVEVSDKDGDE